MKRNWLLTTALSLIVAIALIASSCSSEVTASRERDFNFDWKFTELTDTVTLNNLPLADGDWRDVRLPHDWSVEHSFSEEYEGCTGYLPGGVGVYQKHFVTTDDANLKSTFILFDGVYNNAKFWLNGEYLGENPYGYSPVYFNMTDILKGVGEENILTVYVDHSRYADSRWYTGSGIYRNVKLITVDKLHIPIWGTFVTTPEVTKSNAKVDIEVTLNNENSAEVTFTLATKVLDGRGSKVAEVTETMTLQGGESKVANPLLDVASPKLWDPENPNMYSAVTTITVEGQKVDEYVTPFGIRAIEFDKDKGFFLNGVSTLIKGVCLHHDAGLVGAAVPKGVLRRRLELLKECGVNAIRAAHNPYSDEFYDLCDEMGFLVQDEIFDELDNPKDKRFNLNEREVLPHTRGYTEHFQEWGESDLRRTVLRNRNHPSIIQYSIGNEIEWTYPEYKDVSGLWDKGTGGYWNKIPHLTPEQMRERYDNRPEQRYNLAQTAERLAKWVKELDTTRPVTANCIIPVASCVTGYAAALDIVGISYQIAQYEWCKKHFPDMMFTGNENAGYLSEWRTCTDNPMVFSMFIWTGIAYLGEARQNWPRKSAGGDLFDLAGFKEAGFNHFRAIWDDDPYVAIQTHSTKNRPKRGYANWDNFTSKPLWNYEDGEMVVVEVVTNQPSATLYLNGESLGEKLLADNQEDLILRWEVPYSQGVLEAKAGEHKAELRSAGKAAALQVRVDNTKLQADGYDVAHFDVQLVDANGVAVCLENQKITFDVEGDLRLLGVDNGWGQSTQDYQSDHVVTHMGRCLAIVQSLKDQRGTATVTVSADGIPAQVVKIKIK